MRLDLNPRIRSRRRYLSSGGARGRDVSAQRRTECQVIEVLRMVRDATTNSLCQRMV